MSEEPKKVELLKRVYKVIKAENGFIIEFEHIDKYYNDENKKVAKDLKEVAEIIGKDLK